MSGLVIASSGFDPTAIATLVLAGIALALVIATLALLSATRASTRQARDAARRQFNLLERQVSASYRPLMIDVLPDAPPPADMLASDREQQPSIPIQLPGMAHAVAIDPRSVLVSSDGARVYISVPMRNVGRGLAVVDESGLALAGAGIGELEHTTVQRPHVPVNETTRLGLVALYADRDSIARGTVWSLRVPYCDLAGGQRTVATLQIVLDGETAQGPWRIERVDQEPARGRRAPLPAPAGGEHEAEPPAPEESDGEAMALDQSEAEAKPRRRWRHEEPVTSIWGQPVRTDRRRQR